MEKRAKEAIAELRRTVNKMKSARKYLNSCGELTYEKYVETHRIAGMPVSEHHLRSTWEGGQLAFPKGNRPGGVEAIRYKLRKSLEEGISECQKALRAASPWWRFW